MDLLDAISSVPDAKSVVEYSLAACFPRSYSTIFKAINEMKLAPMWLPHQLGRYLPRPEKLPFWLLMADVTPGPRPFAHTLEDRGMVYQPEVVKGKLPVTHPSQLKLLRILERVGWGVNRSSCASV